MPGPGFNQVLDVIRSEVITYAADKSGKYTEAPAAGALAEKAEQLHEQLIEYIAESDDSLMEKWIEQGTLSEEEMRAGIHAAMQKQSFIPLFVHVGGKQHRRGPADGFHRQIRLLAGGPPEGQGAWTPTARKWKCR